MKYCLVLLREKRDIKCPCCSHKISFIKLLQSQLDEN